MWRRRRVWCMPLYIHPWNWYYISLPVILSQLSVQLMFFLYATETRHRHTPRFIRWDIKKKSILFLDGKNVQFTCKDIFTLSEIYIRAQGSDTHTDSKKKVFFFLLLAWAECIVWCLVLVCSKRGKGRNMMRCNLFNDIINFTILLHTIYIGIPHFFFF